MHFPTELVSTDSAILTLAAAPTIPIALARANSAAENELATLPKAFEIVDVARGTRPVIESLALPTAIADVNIANLKLPAALAIPTALDRANSAIICAVAIAARAVP